MKHAARALLPYLALLAVPFTSPDTCSAKELEDWGIFRGKRQGFCEFLVNAIRGWKSEGKA